MKRRKFIYKSSLLATGTISGLNPNSGHKVMTVNGPVDSGKIGFTLSHEHILVDFIGADHYNTSRWNRTQVAAALLPHLQELKKLGCKTLIECTPAFLGRDPMLLKDLSLTSGLTIMTNTGYYGAVNNKYLPSTAISASSHELANQWILEYEEGIEGTGIRPGFIKIGVNPGPLSELHRRLVEAAAITHLKTGLTIASHTGFSEPAFEQLKVIQELGVHGSAFIWVHAQNENDKESYLKAARQGAWISLDGLQEEQIHNYIEMIKMMKNNGLLNKVLISQDAGWYEPGKPWNGPSRDYTVVLKQLVPKLKSIGIHEREIKQLLQSNPEEAFSIRVRTL